MSLVLLFAIHGLTILNKMLYKHCKASFTKFSYRHCSQSCKSKPINEVLTSSKAVLYLQQTLPGWKGWNKGFNSYNIPLIGFVLVNSIGIVQIYWSDKSNLHWSNKFFQ